MQTTMDGAGEVRLIHPEGRRLGLLLTAQQAISHGDPGEGDGSNRSRFHRRKVIRPGAPPGRAAMQGEIDRLTARYRTPVPLLELLAQTEAGFLEWLATALYREWLRQYAGQGAADGAERYARLAAFGRDAAVRAVTLMDWWSYLCDAMAVGGGGSMEHLPLVMAPRGVHRPTLDLLERNSLSLVPLARHWKDLEKEGAPAAEALFSAADLDGGAAGAHSLEIPHVSGNSLRHAVREHGSRYLLRRLGLLPDRPGRGPLPVGVEMILFNGGNLEHGVKQPSNPYRLAREVREAYPHLDLMGGNLDAFDLGASRLSVTPWVVCRETREALPEHVAALPNAELSALEYLDGEGLVRVGLDAAQVPDGGLDDRDPKSAGQMITAFETLAAGTQFWVEYGLTPHTRLVTAGALMAALDEWAEEPRVGGQSARGYGRVGITWPEDLETWAADRELYEAHLDAQIEQLREGVTAGTLASSAVVCA